MRTTTNYPQTRLLTIRVDFDNTALVNTIRACYGSLWALHDLPPSKPHWLASRWLNVAGPLMELLVEKLEKTIAQIEEEGVYRVGRAFSWYNTETSITISYNCYPVVTDLDAVRPLLLLDGKIA